MKIEKLKVEEVVYVLADLTQKINEIIDVLNKSFITDEPDTIRMVPDVTCVTGVSIDNHIINGESIIGNAKCPHCGVSHYIELYSTSTTVYHPHIYKDGININIGKNKATTHCECLNCGKEFDI